MKNTLQTVGYIAAAIMAVDVLGFMAWILSGQYPADNFYIGTITAHILRAIL
jgi:hypothetical protein